MLKYTVFVLFVAIATAGEFKFKDCGHHEMRRLELSNCSGDFCTIHKGKDFKLGARFVANQDTSKVEIKITASVSGFETPVSEVDSNACNYIKSCPLKNGRSYEFDYSLAIPKYWPTMKAVLKVQLVGEMGVLACALVNSEVAN